MEKLRYSETFYSLQGEGKFVGVPSVFLRTFGCNFRCQNFGLERDRKKERYNPEVKDLVDKGIHKATIDFNDLPIIHTGCDTYASIYPEFKKFNKLETIDEVTSKLLDLTPGHAWTQDDGQDIHLIITGGEPLLGWQKLYTSLFEHPNMKGLKNVTFETNTTQLLHADLKEYLNNQDFTTTFSCSPKLSVSGEPWKNAIRPEVALDYYTTVGSNMYFKFVVSNRDDVEEVTKAVDEYKKEGIDVPVYLMPMGGRSEEYVYCAQEVSEIALEKGYRFSPRLHIDLFGNAWGT